MEEKGRQQPGDTLFDAVIFDFFGTLTVPVDHKRYRNAIAPVAHAMDVSVDELIDGLEVSFDDRCQGSWGTHSETMKRVASSLGVELSLADLAQVCQIRMDQQRNLMTLRVETMPVLSELASMGLGIGVVSDCTHELVQHWPDLPVADLVGAAVFSVDVGTMKPSPAIYLCAVDRLGVDASRCMYVGDGGSNELSGAMGVGMTAVLLEDESSGDAIVFGREKWRGAAVSSLEHVLDLVTQSHC